MTVSSTGIVEVPLLDDMLVTPDSSSLSFSASLNDSPTTGVSSLGLEFFVPLLANILLRDTYIKVSLIFNVFKPLYGKYIMSHEQLGTKYCPNCVIIKEKQIQLELWEKNLEAREQELEDEIEFIRYNKIY